MLQYTGNMLGNIIHVLLNIYLAFQQCKNFENPLRYKVITMSLVYYFFLAQCIYTVLKKTCDHVADDKLN